jgi:two-component system, NtrC family, sensor kinase
MEIDVSKNTDFIEEFYPFLPFLVCLNQNGDIISIGASLQKSIGANCVGSNIEDVFSFQRPSDWKSLPDENLSKLIIFIKEKRTGLAFKGQALRHSNSNIYLALNPLISANSQIKDFHLTIGDFPVFDTIAEYLFLRQTNSNGIREANVLNDALLEKNKALEKAKKELAHTNASLESKVEERTRELEMQMQSLEISKLEIERKSIELGDALEKLKIAQDEILSKEKMSMLGQLVSGIAHEINTPLGSIKAAAFNLNQTLEFIMQTAACDIGKTHLSVVQELFVQGKRKDILPNEIFDKSKELSVKISQEFPHIKDANSFANKLMSSGVDETTHPFVKYVAHIADYDKVLDLTCELQMLYQGLSTIEIASERASKVVNALKTYVHTDIHSLKTQFNLRSQVDSVIFLFLNATRRGITIQNNIPNHINLVGNPDQLSQVWTNLISNAIHAINGSGMVSFDAHAELDKITIDVLNDGPKIPEELLSSIFKPFFTTKERGIGTGLGLNIIQKIIAQHKGEIACYSTEENTTFRIILPQNFQA